MTYDPWECIAIAVDALRPARHALNTEIRACPTPIAGCDAQVNRLLAERQRMHEALPALNASAFVPTPRQLETGARPSSR